MTISLIWKTFKSGQRDSGLLFDFLFLSTSGAVASFLSHYKPKRREFVNGEAAWDGVVKRY